MALDYLANDGKPLFELPFDNLEMATFVPCSFILAHIVCASKGEAYQFKANKDLLKLFRVGQSASREMGGHFVTAFPVEYVKIHAVLFANGKPRHLGCLKMTIREQKIQQATAVFDINDRDMNAFMSYIQRKPGGDANFFCSVHFGGPGITQFTERYDTTSPGVFRSHYFSIAISIRLNWDGKEDPFEWERKYQALTDFSTCMNIEKYYEQK